MRESISVSNRYKVSITFETGISRTFEVSASCPNNAKTFARGIARTKGFNDKIVRYAMV